MAAKLMNSEVEKVLTSWNDVDWRGVKQEPGQVNESEFIKILNFEKAHITCWHNLYAKAVWSVHS